MSKEEGAMREMTEQEQEKAFRQAQKEAAMQLANYKKRLEEGIRLKRLQVEELELNIKYFNNKKEWNRLQPEIERMEAEEAKKEAERKEKVRKEMEALNKDDATEVEQGSKIVTVKHGKARE